MYYPNIGFVFSSINFWMSQKNCIRSGHCHLVELFSLKCLSPRIKINYVVLGWIKAVNDKNHKFGNWRKPKLTCEVFHLVTLYLIWNLNSMRSLILGSEKITNHSKTGLETQWPHIFSDNVIFPTLFKHSFLFHWHMFLRHATLYFQSSWFYKSKFLCVSVCLPPPPLPHMGQIFNWPHDQTF